MASVIISFSLDPGSKAYKYYEQKFKGSGKRDFSGYMDRHFEKCLEEEHTATSIIKDIEQINLEIEALQSRKAVKESNLKKVQDKELTKETTNINLKEEDRFEYTKDKAERRKWIFIDYLGIKDEETANSLAYEFVKFKEKENIADTNLAIIRFASFKDLEFVKPFPFLSRYENEKIKVRLPVSK